MHMSSSYRYAEAAGVGVVLTVFVHFYMCFLSQFSLFFVFSFCIFVVFFLVVKPVQIIAWKDSLCKMCQVALNTHTVTIM